MKEAANAYLTFILGDEKFAIPVDHVQEIVEFGQVTKVPNAPDYMLGIINLRGRVLPLLDTKVKLGLKAIVPTQKCRVLVLEIHTDEDKSMHIGAMVDIAREVVEINPSDIQDAPEIENMKTSAPVTGIVNNRGDITLIMDIKKVFTLNELNTVTSLN